jgi:protein phosphatase
VAREHAGGAVRCPHCQAVFTVRAPQQAPTGPPRLEIGSATSPGRQRDRNEDSFLVQHLAWSNLDARHDVALLLVADGMGGAASGDRASGLVVRTLGAALAPLLASALSGQARGPAAVQPDTLENALREANTVVYREARADPACKGMGATAVVALVWDTQVLIGNVGDARVYHQRAGKLTQVTRDQTLVARMVELGHLTPAQALVHPSRNEVTQAVGLHAAVEPARARLQLVAGDWLVLACDGLHAHVDATAMQELIARGPQSAAALALELVEAADRGGGSDNTTVIAVRCA